MSRVYLTFDFEAGWGGIDDRLWPQRQANGLYRAMRPMLADLVGRLDRLELSCTWAVVGALIEAPELNDIAHLRGAYRAEAERFVAGAEPETRDGRDMLDMILGARTPQRFASHGYSHVSFTDPEQDDAVLAADLEFARRANKAAGLACDRLVFPCNHVGALEQVGAAGIAKVRTPAMRNGSFAVPAPTLAGRAWAALTTPPAPVTETDHDGVCLHSGTEFLNWGPRAGLAKRVLHKRRISAALELAARGGGDVHFWLHPVDLVETRGLFSHFLTILDRLGQMRDKGQIEIATF